MYSYLCQVLGFRQFTSSSGNICSIVSLLFRYKYKKGEKWEVIDVFVNGELADECSSFPPGMMCRVETMPGNGRIVGIIYDPEHNSIFE